MAWSSTPATSSTNNDKTSGTSFALGTTSGSPSAIGEVWLAFATFDNLSINTPTISAVSKGSQETNNWSRVGQILPATSAAAATVMGEIWGLQTAVSSWSPQDTTTVTLSGAVAAKAGIILRGFTGGSLTTRFSDHSNAGASGGTVSSVVYSAGDLIVVTYIVEDNTAPSGGATWSSGAPVASWSPWSSLTSGGGAASNAAMKIEVGVATSSGTQNVTWIAAGDGGFHVLVLQPAATGGATLTTTAGDVPAAGNSGSFTGAGTLSTTAGGAPAAGGTGALTGTSGGTGATFSTLVGGAPAAGGSGAFRVPKTLTTTVGNAPAAGGTGAFTALNVTTFSTLVGNAPASGGSNVLRTSGTLTTTAAGAPAAGGTGLFSGTRNGTFTTTAGGVLAAGGSGTFTNFDPIATPATPKTTNFEIRTFNTSGNQIGIVPKAAIEFTDEFGTSGYVKISMPALANEGYIDKRMEVAVFREGVELDNSRAIITEHTGNPGAADDEAGKSDERVWGGKTLVARLSKAIVYPQNWPTIDPPSHTFASMTPGMVMSTLLTRAQTRGAIPQFTFASFSSTTDSAGVAWAKTVTLRYEAGVNLLAVLENLVRLNVVEFKMVGRDLRLYNPDTLGTDRTTGASPVILRRGKDLNDAPYSESTEDLQNALLVVGDEGVMFERVDTPSVSLYGREESTLSQGGTRDSGTLITLADASLSRFANERGEYTANFSSVMNPATEPWAAFYTGDWVYLDRDGLNNRYRVRQLTLSTTDDSFNITSTLNDKFAELDLIMMKKVEGILGGASQDTVNPADPPVTEDTTIPNPPTGVGGTSFSYIDETGNPKASAVISWTEPTTNTDGTQITDLAGYIVYMRNDSDTAEWEQVGINNGTGANTFYLSGLPIGVYKRFALKAYDFSMVHVSAMSTEARILLASDTTPPNKPSTPVLNATLGQVTVSWDGKDSAGAAQVSDFQRIDVFASTTSNFTPSNATKIGSLYGAGAMLGVDQTYGTVYYYKFVAYDRAGNASTASDEASIATTALVSGDLAQSIITDIQQGKDAYTATNILLSGSPIYTRDSAGANKWIRVRYNVTTAASTVPTLQMIDGKQILDKTTIVDSTTLAQNLGDNYIGQLRTLVRKDAAGTVTWTMSHDDGAAVYLDGAQVYSNSAVSTGSTVSFNVSVGLHVLDILWAEQTGGDGIYGLSATIASKFNELNAPMSADVNPLVATQAGLTAQAAQTSANGKNKVVHSVSDPSGGTAEGYISGDTWFKYNGSNIIIGQWRFTGSVWQPETIDNVVIANLDAGKITTGTLDANRIAANSLTISQVNGLQTTLNAKTQTFSQSTVPVSTAVGDLWINTGDSNKLYRAASVGADQIIAGEWVLHALTADASIPYQSTAPTSPADGSYWLDSDDGRLYRYNGASYTNMVSNPSLETDTTGWSPQLVSLSRSTAWSQFGSASLRSVPSGTDTDNYVYSGGGDTGGMRYGMVANQTYTVSAYCYVPVALTGTSHSTRPARIVFFYKNSGGTYVEAASAQGPVSGGTARLSVTVTIPSGATEAFIRFYNGYTNSATNAIHWDGIMLTQGSTLYSYVDTSATGGWVDVSDSRVAATDTLVNGWKMTGQTTINGGQIATDTITSAQILAGAIGVTKLAVGDTSNFIEINESSAPAVIATSPAGDTHQIENIAGVLWSKRSANTSAEFYLRNKKGPIPFATNDVVRIRLNAFADASTNATMWIHTYNSAGTFIGSQQIGSAVTIGTTDALFTFEGTIGSAIMADAAQYLIGLNNMTTGRNVRVRAARAYLMNAGELLVDGSISTLKLAANSVTADRIAAGAITAEKIGLGVIRTNLIGDPSFEEDYTFGTWDLGNGISGNVAQWRQTGTAGGSATRVVGDGRSGSTSAHIYTQGGTADYSILSPSFQIESGKTYKIIVNATALTSNAKLVVQIWTGADAAGPWPFNYSPTVTGVGTWMGLEVPFVTTVIPDSYQTYAGEFTSSGNYWALLRVMNYQSTAASTLVVDDISVVEMGAGGASELTAAGLRLFDNTGDEVGAFVSNRPNYFSVTKSVGGISESLASINSLGGADFTDLSADNDPIFEGFPMLGTTGDWSSPHTDGGKVQGHLDKLGRGLIAIGRSAGATYSSGSIAEISFFAEPGRSYRLSFSGAYGYSTSSGAHGFWLGYATPTSPGGDATGVTAPAGQYSYRYQTAANLSGSYPAVSMTLRCNKNGTTAGGELNAGRNRFFMGVDSTLSIAYGWDFTVEDMGPDIPDTYTGNTSSVASSGAVQTYTTTWVCNSSEAYTGAGAAETWTTDLMQGYYSSSNANQYSLALFTGNGTSGQGVTVATAMTSATLVKAEVYLYFKSWYYNSGGTAVIRANSLTSLTSTAPSGTAVTSANWPKPGGRWVDITSIWNSSMRGIWLGPGPSNSLTYYGRAASHADSSNKPVLRLTYRK